jgi:uncharacterized membrane protein
MHPNALSILFDIVILACLASVYFYPSIVAAKRKVKNQAVILVNVFLGWTVIGWLAAIIMATTMLTIFAAAIEQEAFSKMHEQPNPKSAI